MADRNLRFALAAVALPFFLLAMSGMARAATITVQTALDDTNPGHCTLREAINSANGAAGTGTCAAGTGNDTIEFSDTDPIVLLSTLPAIARTLTITGPTTSGGIAIVGDHSVELMVVNSGATVNLQFLTLEDGSVTGPIAGDGLGGAILNNGTLTVANSTFSANQATGGSAVDGNSPGSGNGGAI